MTLTHGWMASNSLTAGRETMTDAEMYLFIHPLWVADVVLRYSRVKLGLRISQHGVHYESQHAPASRFAHRKHHN